jgi:hypothetical protein
VARTSIVATIIAWSLLIPTAAGAKGLEQTLMVVSGPGLERPLILERDEWGIPRGGASPQAVVTEGLVGGYPKWSRPPAERLRPAYEVHYQLSVYDPRVDWPVLTLMHQRLYPYAEPTPVTYTPAQFWEESIRL